MKTINNDTEIEYIEKKSSFIASIKKVSTEEEAREFISKKNEEHSTATHNVYSYRIKNQNGEIIKYSDDGEPLNTAGKPSFEILNKLDIYNVVVVVTRYFGGIKLGAGGLIRAYAKATKLAVEKAKIIDYVEYREYIINFEYKDISNIDNFLMKNNIEILDKGFSDTITYKIKIELDKIEDIKNIPNISIIDY